MNILSLFSGAGGLDLGFEKAGYNIIWANEYDKNIWNTYKYNFPNTHLVKENILKINDSKFPKNIDGIIGGPPCQSFSEAGKGLGIKDDRGKLFFEYIRVLNLVSPKFFLAENVSGLMHKKHKDTVEHIINQIKKINYNVFIYNINANDFRVPTDRKRVFFIGFRKDINFNPITFNKYIYKPNLKDAIYDLKDNALPSSKNKSLDSIKFPNHEYMTGGFSSIFKSRNRVRSWNEPSFTIQATGRHAPLHPKAPKMLKIAKDKNIFVKGKEHLYRRLSIRECARIQSFPDDFIFKYNNLSDGYKMIGNAVPPLLSFYIANKIRSSLGFKELNLGLNTFNLPYIYKILSS